MQKHLNMTFKVPNCIITDPSLQLSSRVLLITLYSCCNPYRTIENKTVRAIAGLAGLSVRCTTTGLRALESKGYIRIRTHKRFDRESNRVMNAASSYVLVLETKQNYTKLPRALFHAKSELSAADFCIAAYLHMLGAKKRRAFPSKAKIADALGIAKSTVALTLAKIKNNQIGTLLLQHCRRRRGEQGGDFAANSYYIVIDTISAIRSTGHQKNRAHRKYQRHMNRISHPSQSLTKVDLYGQFSLSLSYYDKRPARRKQSCFLSRGCPKFAQQELQT